jgi:hypothetical protein
MRYHGMTRCVSLALCLATAAARTACPAEVDVFVPSDCEAVVVVNVREALKSPVIQRYGPDRLKTEFESNPDIKKYLRAAGIDPFRDVHQVIFAASPGTDAELKFLVVIHSEFDIDKIQATLVTRAKSDGALQVIEHGSHKIFEVRETAAGGIPVYAAFADNTTLILSPWVKQTDAGIHASARVNPALAAAMQDIGGKEAVYAAVVVTDRMQQVMARNVRLRDIGPKLQYLAGTLDLAGEPKLNVSLRTSDAKSADKLKETLSRFVPLAGMMAADRSEKLGPAVTGLIKHVQIAKDDKNTVTVSLTVTADMMKEIGESTKRDEERKPATE